MTNHFLFTGAGRQYLEGEYSQKGRSTYEIAQDKGTYANFVRRALKFHGIKLRSKSEAQKTALKTGRHEHPTKGRERTPQEKNKIGNGMADVWKNMDPDEKKERSEKAKKQWEDTPEKEKRKMFKAAGKAIRKAADEGSKLERYLAVGLGTMGYKTTFHAEFVIANEAMHVDLLLPKEKIAIEIDGPTHYLPIFGDEQLTKRQKADQEKNGLLVSQGYTVIRVANLWKSLSDFRMRKYLTELKNLIESILNSSVKDKVIILEV